MSQVGLALKIMVETGNDVDEVIAADHIVGALKPFCVPLRVCGFEAAIRISGGFKRTRKMRQKI